MIIAAHDRFGDNERGCYAGTDRLAECANCDPSTVWRSIRRLIKLGYVIQEEDPKDRRKRIHRVIYNDADAQAMRVASQKKKTARLQSIKPEIDCIEKCQDNDSVEEIVPNIFRETENISRETNNRFSETATSNNVVALQSHLGNCPSIDKPQWLSSVLTILQEDPEAILSYPENRDFQSLICEIDRKWNTNEISSHDAQLILTRLQSDAYDRPDVNWSPQLNSQIERILGDIELDREFTQDSVA
ncbi:MAG: helix-turn-helix domain-containing protein [Alphaproteobacteria bacterium]|nr:helix-turn-helix domain-containing protein [Alphaproteobacteria bacterium]